VGNSRAMVTIRECLLLMLFMAGRLGAEHLPLHLYTSADGLAADGEFAQIIQDSRGFL
jgi:hypothetical protein